uniref:Ubiquitin-like domain-containing protein n=1 Tax=Leersia perrieri TaxID=77586 RepID=A0A0D9X0N6_9ORYZ
MSSSRSAIAKRSRAAMSAAGGEADSSSPVVKPSKLITLRVKDREVRDGLRITRTMRRTDKLSDLIKFYLAMLPDHNDIVAVGGVFMHYGRTVTGDKTPADYDMEDGDEVSFFSDGHRTGPVTLTVKDGKGRRITQTMRRSHILSGLFSLYFDMLPPGAPKEGSFVHHGREVNALQTPSICHMKDGDEITFCPFSKPSFFVTITMKGNEDGCNVTRTMRRADKLQDLIDFYFAMVPTDDEDGEWAVMYSRWKKTPADYEMEDGDQLRLVSMSKRRSMFVTVSLEDTENAKRVHSLRRTDKLQVCGQVSTNEMVAPFISTAVVFVARKLRMISSWKMGIRSTFYTLSSGLADDGVLGPILPARKVSKFETVDFLDLEGVKHAHTLQRADELQGLMDLCSRTLPATINKHSISISASRSAMAKRSRSAMSATGGDQAGSSSPEFKPSKLITLRVKDSEGVRITRTMRTTDKLRDLMGFYLAMVPTDTGSHGVFMHYGRKVRGDQAPVNYDMDDGDEINFFVYETERTCPAVTLTVKDNKGRRRSDHLLSVQRTEFLRHPHDEGDGDGCSVTRTMRRTDKLQDLINFYFAMVQADDEHGEWAVIQVDGEETQVDYEMEDGDQLRVFSGSKRSSFVTVTLILRVADNIKHEKFTLRRTDKLQDLMDLCSSMDERKYKRGCVFAFEGRRVEGSQTPDDLELEDGDMIDAEKGKLITLTVKDREGVRITRTMRTTDKMRDLTDFYLAMMPLPPSVAAYLCTSCRWPPTGDFMYYGRRVKDDQTPADYDMEDGDEITFYSRFINLIVALSVKDNKGLTVARTMSRFDKLNVLFDLYFAMLPSTAQKERFFMYQGRNLNGELPPGNYEMEDGAEITFVPISKPSMFVTLKMKGKCGRSVTRTMRRTDKLQDLVDFCHAMVPTSHCEHRKCEVVYCGRQIVGKNTPADNKMEDGDLISLSPVTTVNKRSMFVTIKCAILAKNIQHTHTPYEEQTSCRV